MLQAGGGLDFPQKAVRPQRVGDLGVQHLDRHLAPVLEIVGQENGRHAAAITAWRGALSAERQAMTIVTTLDRLRQDNPSPALETERVRIRDLASDLADDAAQDALATSIIVFAVLIALAMALWYSRRRLAE